MKINILCNLGRNDAAVLELDHMKFREGTTVDVAEKTAESLVRLGVAEIPAEPKKPRTKAGKSAAKSTSSSSVTGDLKEDDLKS